MKQTFFKIRNIFYVLAFSGAMLSIATPSFAKTKKQKEALPSLLAKAPKVEYISTDGDGQLFKISFEANNPVRFDIAITDDHGTLLYRDEFESASFAKYFKLVNEGYGSASDFNFTILEKATGISHVFDVTHQTTVVKDVVITKL